jgi:hypothetical protein
MSATSRRSSGSSEYSPRPYRYLEAQVCTTSRETINSKWAPLDQAATDYITEILQSASQPVLRRFNDAQKIIWAKSSLDIVFNRVHGKLNRGMPFPPASSGTTREAELQYEQTLDGAGSLADQLTPLLHSVELLKREKERAERDLEQDYQALTTLRHNATAEAREKRARLRKVHILVDSTKREDDEKANDLDMMGELATKPQDASKALVSGLKDDEELRKLAEQIGKNMESMRGNVQQIEGIGDAVAKSRAVLWLALLPHLDQAQLEKVNLG